MSLKCYSIRFDCGHHSQSNIHCRPKGEALVRAWSVESRSKATNAPSAVGNPNLEIQMTLRNPCLLSRSLFLVKVKPFWTCLFHFTVIRPRRTGDQHFSLYPCTPSIFLTRAAFHLFPPCNNLWVRWNRDSRFTHRAKHWYKGLDLEKIVTIW